jgi:hypothetical protein
MSGPLLVALIACRAPDDDPSGDLAVCDGLTDDDRLLGPISMAQHPDGSADSATAFLTEGSGTLCVRVEGPGDAAAQLELDGEAFEEQALASPMTWAADDDGGLHTIGIGVPSDPDAAWELGVFARPPLRAGTCPFDALDMASIGVPWEPPWYGSRSTDSALYSAVLIDAFCGETGLAQAGYVVDDEGRLGGLTVRLRVDLTANGGGVTSIDDQVSAAEDHGCLRIDVPTNAWNTQALWCSTGSLRSLRAVLPAEYGLACRRESCPFDGDGEGSDG